MNSRTIFMLVFVIAILFTVVAFKTFKKSEDNVRIIRDIYYAGVTDKYMPLKAYTSLKRVIHS